MRKYKKRAASLCSAVLAFTMTITGGAVYSDGEMAVYAADGISISTAEDLQKIGTNGAYPLSGDYVLTEDIDMAGVDFTPIGGGSGTRGSSAGNNVFTGTFNGNGHIISNLSVHKTGSSSEDWQYGLFGMIGSDDESDKASVKNLILTGIDVNVDMSGSGYLSLGGLAGEINHNAEIDNVAIINGTVVGNPSNGGDMVGVGGLIGEMRYENRSSGGMGGWGGQQTSGNNGVTISNVYVGADVTAGGSKDNNYAAGIIGRIAKSSPASMTACIFTGNFTVPMSVAVGGNTETVTWSSDNPAVSIGEDGTVTVGEVYADTACILTASTASGLKRDFKITVVGKVSLKIDQEYAAVGKPLTASMADAPVDMQCTYEWSVGGTVKSTGQSYTPTNDDLEKMLTVKATAVGDYAGTYQTSMYISKLPVLYVDTEGGQAITSKDNYINGNFKIQGNTTYNSGNTTLYDGAIQIRGRGNTTWGYDKKPYKIKLDTKTDLFGFGKNKHWVLLANYTDESHMRNTLSYNLSGEMGMPYMQSVHVDLVLNGEYMGTYQFCEQVKIASGRVNIHDWEDYAGDVAKAVYKAEKDHGLAKDDQDSIETLLAEDDMSWLTTGKFTYKNKEYNIKEYLADMPDFTGGVLIELDSYFDEYSKFKSSKNQPLQFKSPEFIATNTEAMDYVENYINAFESAISASDFTTVYNNKTVSYSQLFDMDSLVQFWMVNELFMNVDAMKKSTYMYKDIDGLFHMGPIWDMDWSSDSIVSNYQGSGTYNAWQTVKFSDAAQENQWYKSIIQDPYFAVKAYELYTQMREKMGTIVASGGTLDTYQKLLSESAEANANIWYQRESNKKFDTQTAALKNYLTNRLNWLDTQFQSPETLAESLGYTTAGGITVKAGKANSQESAVVMLTADVTDGNVKSVEFLVNGVKLGTAAVTGSKAVLEAPQSALVSSGSYNTVQVFGLNAEGRVVTSDRNKVTDFEKFYADKEEEPENPVGPTDPSNPENPTDPSNPANPGVPENPTDPGSEKKLKAPAKVNAGQLSSSQYVKVAFSKVSGAKEYEIYRSAKAKSGYKKIGNTKSLSYTDKKVQKGKTYYYKVVAKAEKESYNSPLSEKYGEVKVLACPSVKVKAAKAGKITVSWKKVSGAKGYIVYTSTKKTKGYKTAKIVNKPKAGKVTLKASKGVKKQYIKVRAFYKKNGSRVYGPYSKVITLKVKK